MINLNVLNLKFKKIQPKMWAEIGDVQPILGVGLLRSLNISVTENGSGKGQSSI